MYRSVLYNDDFSQRSLIYTNTSVGGFYLQRSGLSGRCRRKLSSILPVTITTHRGTTNMFFESIIDDILKASNEGVDTIPEYCTKCNVFVKVFRFLAYYPATAYVLDVLNQMVRCPRTHCMLIWRVKGSVSLHSYSSIINSSNPSYTRKRTYENNVY